MTLDRGAATQRRRHREMLAISVAVLVLAFLLQTRSDGRVAARGLTNYPLPPLCGSQLFFNTKCPGCGLTRSFVYWAGGDFATAQRAHRFGGLMFMTLVLQIPYRLVALKRPGAPPLGQLFPRLFGYALIAALLGNWLFEACGILPDELASLTVKAP